MSKCKIKGINCDFSLGDKRCVMDMPCDEIVKWLVEHDKQIRADAIEECKQILLDAMARDGKTKCHEYMIAFNEMEKLQL